MDAIPDIIDEPSWMNALANIRVLSGAIFVQPTEIEKEADRPEKPAVIISETEPSVPAQVPETTVPPASEAPPTGKAPAGEAPTPETAED
jgi:hypothetical protein